MNKNMNKSLLALLGIVGTGILLVVILLVMCISFHNKDTGLRIQQITKQTDNRSEMDAMWKIIDQSAQVTVMQKNALMDIFTSYAEGRTGGNGNASLMKWIQEAIPNVDQTTYTKLMNTITAQREGFKFRQKELLDIKRERDTNLDRFPGVLLASICPGDHKKIDVVIVTSSRTEEAFKTGKDDNTTLPGVQRNK
jgi:hypothetical protein